MALPKPSPRSLKVLLVPSLLVLAVGTLHCAYGAQPETPREKVRRYYRNTRNASIVTSVLAGALYFIGADTSVGGLLRPEPPRLVFDHRAALDDGMNASKQKIWDESRLQGHVVISKYIDVEWRPGSFSGKTFTPLLDYPFPDPEMDNLFLALKILDERQMKSASGDYDHVKSMISHLTEQVSYELTKVELEDDVFRTHADRYLRVLNAAEEWGYKRESFLVNLETLIYQKLLPHQATMAFRQVHELEIEGTWKFAKRWLSGSDEKTFTLNPNERIPHGLSAISDLCSEHLSSRENLYKRLAELRAAKRRVSILNKNLENKEPR